MVFLSAFDAILSGEIHILITNDILSKYAEIIEKKMSPIVSLNITEFLSQSNYVEQVEIYYKWALIHLDEDDNKFVDCAINGNTDFLVTDDKYFRGLNKIDFPAIQVIRTAQFAEMLLK